MLWAAFCLGFFGFMRACEFTFEDGQDSQTSLLASDVTTDSHLDPQILTIHFRHSKTDQFGAGHHIHLGRTHDTLCPVTSVLSYMAIRPNTADRLFVFQDGSALTRSKLTSHLREAVASIALKPKGYSGHSFRIGAASTAAAVGLSDTLIQQAGRWRSEAFRLYVRTPNEQLAAISRSLIA